MRRRRGKTLPNGRNEMRQFVMLEHWVLKTEAFRSLSVGARSLILELLLRFNGVNNGRIGLGEREAAIALNRSRPAVRGYFRELQQLGFIVCARAGGFNMKVPTDRRASEWRLTWLPTETCPATKEFVSWRPDIEAQSAG
jgi:hypothetical protein